MQEPYNSYSSSLLRRHGYRIYRVGVDASFSCPNRCRDKDGAGCVYCDSHGARATYLRTSESGFHHDSGFEKDIDLKSGPMSDNEYYHYSFDEEDIRQQIERGMEFLGRRYGAEHFALYFQSFSNTFASCEKLKELYDYAMSLNSWEGLIVSTRPDCIDDGKLSLLSSYDSDSCDVCVELGLQSGNDAILKAMNRGHDRECFLRGARMVKDHGLKLCVHVLTGFPGEGRRELDETIEVINAVHPDAMKIHNLNVCSGTVLYDRFLGGEITTPCSTRHMENVIYILRRIPSDVVIERLMCETPNHRLASPRLFPDKNSFLRLLERTMAERAAHQGDLCQEP